MTEVHTTRRCLLIAGVFPPAGGAGAVRLAKLCRNLPAEGWTVDVVAPNGGAGWHRDESLLRGLGAIRVFRTGPRVVQLLALGRLRARLKDPGGEHGPGRTRQLLTLLREVRDWLAVPDEYLGWSVLAAQRALRLVHQQRYDALLTSSFPYSVHLAGALVSAAGGPPWVAELRDPWHGNRFRRQARPWRRQLDAWMERLALRRARAVIALSPGAAELLRNNQHSSAKAPVHVITNGFDRDDFAGNEPGQVSLLTLTYVGTWTASQQSPATLLAALARLLAMDVEVGRRLTVRLVGGADLDSAAMIRAFLRRPGARTVLHSEPFVDHRAAQRAMMTAGALFLDIHPHTPWLYPAKLFEYLGSGRPILASVPPGDTRALLERCGGATILPAGDDRALAGALIAALDAGRFVPAVPRRDDQVAVYELRSVAKRYARVLEGTLD